MNNTVNKLTNLAWSKLENLSKLRKFLQNELDHSHSFLSIATQERLQQGLEKIDLFTSDFSRFLLVKRSRRLQPELLEAQFDELSDRYATLMQDLESLVQP